MTVKIKRAAKLSQIGDNRATFLALLAHVPTALRQSMTSRQIADMVDALFACAQESKASAASEAVENGVIWDAKQQRLREIAA